MGVQAGGAPASIAGAQSSKWPRRTQWFTSFAAPAECAEKRSGEESGRREGPVGRGRRPPGSHFANAREAWSLGAAALLVFFSRAAQARIVAIRKLWCDRGDLLGRGPRLLALRCAVFFGLFEPRFPLGQFLDGKEGA